MTPEINQDWLCPNLSSYWQIGKLPKSNQLMLCSPWSQMHYPISPAEAQALRYFTGQFTVAQVQQQCQQTPGDISPTFVVELIQKLIDCQILSLELTEPEPSFGVPQLKPSVQWFPQSRGYWILRNPENVTRPMQVSDRHKAAIEQLGRCSVAQILHQHDLNPTEFRTLLQQLATTGMLVGTEPAKAPKRKFTPLRLLFFSLPLCNPDPWLSRSVQYLRWLWTPQAAVALACFLAVSVSYGMRQQSELTQMASALWTQRDGWLVLSFGLLSLMVVSLHELGHAFTLKHFNRSVPEVGLMFMFLFPAAYTNTTDQYSLTRWQRSLVVGAGVICQITIAALAFWLWQGTSAGTWLHTASYLSLVAALLTVTVNLNPLSKFDGYYLALAVTGINNLRSRSFALYAHFLRRQPIQEEPRDRWILALYAPFSLAYSLTVLSFLLLKVTGWSSTNAPILVLLSLLAWLIYFYFPTTKERLEQ